MVLPSNMQKNLLPEEINFLSENELITILPRFSMKKIELVGTKIPTLRAMRREQVPLWVALILKSQDKCNIVPPEWLNLAYLRDMYEQEKLKPLQFSSLPNNWLELSKILLAKAPDDIADLSHQLRSIIQDLREIRLVKIKNGLKELNEANMELTNLSLMEINEIRPFILQVMGKLGKLYEASKTVDDEENDYDYDYE